MYHILKNSSAVRKKIRDLFSVKTRKRKRIVIVAYVGADAPSLLPDAKGVRVYCWPQVGATHPEALYNLKKKGAEIFLVDGLHMKLYWVENEGAIVTSANLSYNALGDRGLHEFGLFLDDPASIDIESIVASLSARKLTLKEWQDLKRKHDLFWAKHSNSGGNIRRTKKPSYLEWYREQKTPWKLGIWHETGDPSRASSDKARKEYGVIDIADFLTYNYKKNLYRKGDWILRFNGSSLSKIDWMFVQFVNKIPEDDPVFDGKNPYEAVQVTKISRLSEEPFNLNDSAFKTALKFAVSQYGLDKIEKAKSLKPPPQFLKILAQEVKSVRRNETQGT